MLLACSQPASAAIAAVNFDPPGTPLGPSVYVAAGGPQTISTTPATFTGGVVLGFATFFPAISFATAPNVYGTADFGIGLSKTLDIGVNPGFATSEVSFALFNGETFGQSYTATAFNGTTAVASQTLFNIPANFNAGYGVVDLNAASITSVSISAVGAPSVWDFLIDTVAFNQTLQQGVASLPPPLTPPPPAFIPPPPVTVTVFDSHHRGKKIQLRLNYGDSKDGRGTLHSLDLSAVPEPAAWAMMLVGFGGIGAVLRGRRARTAPAAA